MSSRLHLRKGSRCQVWSPNYKTHEKLHRGHSNMKSAELDIYIFWKPSFTQTPKHTHTHKNTTFRLPVWFLPRFSGISTPYGLVSGRHRAPQWPGSWLCYIRGQFWWWRWSKAFTKDLSKQRISWELLELELEDSCGSPWWNGDAKNLELRYLTLVTYIWR